MRFEPKTIFLEFFKNVQICRHFGTPFVLVFSRSMTSSDRFFFFRQTFFFRRHCDSILTCNLSFLFTAVKARESEFLNLRHITSYVSLLVYMISGAGVPQKYRVQKLVKKSRFVQTANFFRRRSYFNKVQFQIRKQKILGDGHFKCALQTMKTNLKCIKILN